MGTAPKRHGLINCKSRLGLDRYWSTEPTQQSLPSEDVLHLSRQLQLFYAGFGIDKKDTQTLAATYVHRLPELDAALVRKYGHGLRLVERVLNAPMQVHAPIATDISAELMYLKHLVGDNFTVGQIIEECSSDRILLNQRLREVCRIDLSICASFRDAAAKTRQNTEK